MNNVPEELVKEVYAWFGLAYYHSECLHRELANIYAILTFKDVTHTTTSRAEEKMAFAHSLTLGRLVNELQDLLSEDLLRRLKIVVDKRNFLAHHFWYDRVYLMNSQDGLKNMLDELSSLSEIFNALDNDLSLHFRDRWNEFELTDELVTQTLAKTRGKPIEPLPKSRKLKKEEEIIAVWNVPTEEGITLVFQTSDSCLWELCDIGLGQTHFSKIESSWIANEDIQKYLPKRISPRPKQAQSWDYEFNLGKGSILWIKKSLAKKSFKWGISNRNK